MIGQSNAAKPLKERERGTFNDYNTAPTSRVEDEGIVYSPYKYRETEGI